MGRRRLQQKGDLRKVNGYWRLRWREDQLLTDGTLRYGWSRFRDVGPATGEKRMTRKEAERAAWENFLSRLDENMRTPQSILTVAEFVERRFLPEHVVMLKHGGQVHYGSVLRYILDGIPEQRQSRKGLKMVRDEHGNLSWPEESGRRFHGLGRKRMRDLGHEDVQRLVSEALKRGLSVQTAKHIKNAVSAIFTFADRVKWFSGRNPAKAVKLPEMQHKPVHVPTFEALNGLLSALKPMARTMVLCASLTSMNIAEICGLRWKRVNLTAEPAIVDGEVIPAFHVAVREQWYLRQWGSVKVKARRRFVPIEPALLLPALLDLRSVTMRGPESPVFSGAAGAPIDQSAMLNRQIRPAAMQLGLEKIGWHDLRRSFATNADALGLSPGEIQALMGHSRFGMTLRYTHTPTAAAVAALGRMGQKVKGAVN